MLELKHVAFSKCEIIKLRGYPKAFDTTYTRRRSVRNPRETWSNGKMKLIFPGHGKNSKDSEVGMGNPQPSSEKLKIHYLTHHGLDLQILLHNHEKELHRPDHSGGPLRSQTATHHQSNC
jgi:hypothetical protein